MSGEETRKKSKMTLDIGQPAESPAPADCLVGTAKGLGEEANTYLFLTSDNQETKIGELVYYRLGIEEAERNILGKILVEELMKPYNRAAVLVVDPHGEYDTLKGIEGHPEFRDGDYSPCVRIFRPDTIRVRLSSLTENDIRYLLPNLTEKMSYFLSRAYRTVTRGRDKLDSYLWGVRDLENALKSILKSGEAGELVGAATVRERKGREAENQGREDSETRTNFDAKTIQGLLWRLDERFDKSSVFSDKEHIPLDELFRPGRCTIFQLSEIDPKEQQVIVGALLRRIYKARIDSVKGRVADRRSESYIPYPVFILLSVLVRKSEITHKVKGFTI